MSLVILEPSVEHDLPSSSLARFEAQAAVGSIFT